MSLTEGEQDSLRFHLGYGNIGPEGSLYTSDGFYELFRDVISPNLSEATETTSDTAIDVGEAGANATVTPASMTGIVSGVTLVVDVADQAETIAVRAVTGSTFTAFFKKDHPSGYPIGTLRGVTRLRTLLWAAERAYSEIIAIEVADNAGLKSVDKEDVVWFEGFRALRDRVDHYMNIVCAISSLVQVEHRRSCKAGRGSTQLEAY